LLTVHHLLLTLLRLCAPEHLQIFKSLSPELTVRIIVHQLSKVGTGLGAEFIRRRRGCLRICAGSFVQRRFLFSLPVSQQEIAFSGDKKRFVESGKGWITGDD